MFRQISSSYYLIYIWNISWHRSADELEGGNCSAVGQWWELLLERSDFFFFISLRGKKPRGKCQTLIPDLIFGRSREMVTHESVIFVMWGCETRECERDRPLRLLSLFGSKTFAAYFTAVKATGTAWRWFLWWIVTGCFKGPISKNWPPAEFKQIGPANH